MTISNVSSSSLLQLFLEGQEPDLETLTDSTKKELLADAIDCELDGPDRRITPLIYSLRDIIRPASFLEAESLAIQISRFFQKFSDGRRSGLPLTEIQHHILVELVTEFFRRSLHNLETKIPLATFRDIAERYRAEAARRCYRVWDSEHLVAACDRLSFGYGWFSCHDSLGRLLVSMLSGFDRDTSGFVEGLAKFEGFKLSGGSVIEPKFKEVCEPLIVGLSSALVTPKESFLGRKNVTLWFDPWNVSIFKCILLTVGAESAPKLCKDLINIIEAAYLKVPGCGYLLDTLAKASIIALASNQETLPELERIKASTKIKALKGAIERTLRPSEEDEESEEEV